MTFSVRTVSKQGFHGSVPKQLCSPLLHLVLYFAVVLQGIKDILFSSIAVLCHTEGSFPLPCSTYSAGLEPGDLEGPF